MDLPVKATVHLNIFPNEAEVRQILRSHDFVLTDLSSDQVCVKGSFLKLKAAKASLEQLLLTKTDIAAPPEVSFGAISKHYASDSSASHGNRGRDGHASPPSPKQQQRPSKHPAAPEYRASPTPDQRGSFRSGRESFVVDGDVFRYAKQLRKKDIEGIVDSHNVRMEVNEICDSFDITLLGKSARIAVGKLQSLMNDLNKSLRTQEVPLKDMDQDGRALLKTIQKEKNIHNSVLVCQMNDKLHLIGPSGASYELKQRLMGRPVGRTGRTSDKNSRRRSSSLPPVSRKNAERDSGAIAKPSPVGSTGYSPLRYQDGKQEAAGPNGGATSCGRGGALRGRSHSECRGQTRAERVNVQEAENKQTPPISPKKGLKQLFNFNAKDIRKKLKSSKK